MYYVKNRPKVRESHKNYYNYSKSKTSEMTAENNNVKTYTKKSLIRSESYERVELFLNCAGRGQLLFLSYVTDAFTRKV